MSDQSDIESRIRALKEELKKRKSMAYQLKKEQRKRHKERLKAQEASLLKQLEVSVWSGCIIDFMFFEVCVCGVGSVALCKCTY